MVPRKKATPNGETPNLGEFEGDTIIGTAIILTNAGDGLSDLVETEAIVLHRGQRGFVLFEYETAKIRHESPKGKETDCGEAIRVQILKAGTATFVDSTYAAEAIALQAEKNLVARERREGVTRLPMAEVQAHEAGEHADGIVEGCPLCTEEQALVEAGQ